MSERQISEKCGARLPNVRGGEDYVCELAPHSKFQKHCFGGVRWTDGGAERIRQEVAAKQGGKNEKQND